MHKNEIHSLDLYIYYIRYREVHFLRLIHVSHVFCKCRCMVTDGGEIVSKLVLTHSAPEESTQSPSIRSYSPSFSKIIVAASKGEGVQEVQNWDHAVYGRPLVRLLCSRNMRTRYSRTYSRPIEEKRVGRGTSPVTGEETPTYPAPKKRDAVRTWTRTPSRSRVI